MHQCIGPCEFDIDPKVYDEMSDKVVRFMNGDTKDVETQLQTKMLEASQALEFEKAQEYKEMLESIRHVVNDKQNIEKKINSLIITNTVFLQLHHNTFKSIHYRNKKLK